MGNLFNVVPPARLRLWLVVRFGRDPFYHGGSYRERDVVDSDH